MTKAHSQTRRTATHVYPKRARRATEHAVNRLEFWTRAIPVIEDDDIDFDEEVTQLTEDCARMCES